ncbi:MAG: FMN-binding protein [Actinomycetota bacterium]|nr:FMN-binding protein [Actinomycetota bacterium]
MRRALAAFFATVAGMALLLGYKTSPGPGVGQVAAAPPPPATATTEPPLSPSPTTRAPSATSAPPAPAGSGPTGTFTGPVVNTRYGPVQVQVTLTAGKLTDVRAGELPVGRSRSASLSDLAAPILRSEALAAQGSHIDSVSGASITSRAYAQSLQAALDAARG